MEDSDDDEDESYYNTLHAQIRKLVTCKACIDLLVIGNELPELKRRIRRLLSVAVGEDGEGEVDTSTVEKVTGMMHEAIKVTPSDWGKSPLEYTRALMPHLCAETRDLEDTDALANIVKTGVEVVIKAERVYKKKKKKKSRLLAEHAKGPATEATKATPPKMKKRRKKMRKHKQRKLLKRQRHKHKR